MNLTHRLLLLLARVELPESDRELTRWCAARVNWELLAELAMRGGVAGMVARHLEGLEVPRAVRRRLVVASLATEQRNRVLVEEARRICERATAAGVPLVPLKGAALHLMGGPFADPSMRHMVDLDLLTSRTSLDDAEALLRDRGFVEDEGRDHYLRYYHHLSYRRPVSGLDVHIELHWTALHVMFSRPELDEALLSRARRCQALVLLSPEDLWLTSALHLAVHRYRGELKWIVDLAECARALPIDWGAVDRTAATIGAKGALGDTAWLTSQLMGVSIPLAASIRTALLRRVSPPELLVGSSAQPGLCRRLAVNVAQYDWPLMALDWSAHKGLELLDRYLGVRLPRPTRRSAAAEVSRR